MSFLCADCAAIVTFYKDTSHIRATPLLYDLALTHYMYNEPIFKIR